jgi:hypothetical protein
MIDVPGMLSVPAKIRDEDSNELADPDWNREACETQYVLAEFLVAKGLVPARASVDRTPDLVIQWSELSDTGKAFIKSAYAKWMKSIDRRGTTEAVKAGRLEKRWQKFASEPSAKVSSRNKPAS